ncbi:4-hydroxy-tetrahydrodipicolinate synthase [soil metagenome]
MSGKLTGTGVALVTPFTYDQKVDYNGLAKLLEHTSSGGVDYFVIHGTTGESTSLTSTEKAAILKFIKENNDAKLPLIYGLGGNNTNNLLEDLKKVDFDGITAILSVCPYYNKPSQEGIYQHYTTFADQAPVPVILYNVPSRTSVNITASTTIRLAQHPNIGGIKESSGLIEQCLEISANKPHDFSLISGDDLMTIPLISIGGVGLISVLANALPAAIKTMVRGALDNNYQAASQAAFDLLSLNPLMYKESNPVGVKHALKVLGVCENYVRLPLVAASAALQKEISEAMETLDLVKAGI